MQDQEDTVQKNRIFESMSRNLIMYILCNAPGRVQVRVV